MKYLTHSEEETKNIGKNLIHSIKGGTIICLHGDLGAGKTTLVQGIAAGYGITSNITSPTFTLMNIYEITTKEDDSPSRLIHIDTYRLKDEKELVGIGAEDYLGDRDTVAIIEWPEKIPGLLQNKNVVNIRLNHGRERNEREIIVD